MDLRRFDRLVEEFTRLRTTDPQPNMDDGEV